ncbi:tRNASer (uridine44-2'-O)-methyltransferase [Metschnikowia aff. pulcherrima]|uniref:tRNA (uracil-O(2)-)-methyltransferase n=1 Tax=Metschnikowia aff. pulcherrima TaxID=2163413 RepID=A0A4P6XY25_9ASCO|nr:tRNASer (uridine44-2'-O)-methyltransferase [Metschnikowia aff. pulcherrima]
MQNDEFHTMKPGKDPEMDLLMGQESCLGAPWSPIYEQKVDFGPHHFETAMAHLIREPNINSTVIMRADILQQITYTENGDLENSECFTPELPESKPENQTSQTDTPQPFLHRDLSDVSLREVLLANSTVKLVFSSGFVRRIIPRNPYKDHVINQTCAIMKGEDSVLVVYIPHISSQDETPFYLPPVEAVGILYHAKKLSIHYIAFNEGPDFQKMDLAERPIRIALRLLQTLAKHSMGAKLGYEKRVTHDLVVPRIAFQNRYIALKKKYLGDLVANWAESTDPKKHVFEDLAVAAFLIELWNARYNDKPFEFRDLGCGNGLLVHILIMEGFKGIGIDARARKSWKTYPSKVQKCLKEQIIIPSVLLKPHPAIAKTAPYITNNGRLFQVPETCSSDPNTVPLMKYYSAANLLELSMVCTTEEFPPETFIIGNHLDELTCWIPLLNFPFMVIPCCSHALNGAKVRYTPRKAVKAKTEENKRLPPKKAENSSMYGALVDHVEDLTLLMGWECEKEILRIPSTRNAAVIGMRKKPFFQEEPSDATEARVMGLVAAEGGAEGWVENLMLLMSKTPKNH